MDWLIDWLDGWMVDWLIDRLRIKIVRLINLFSFAKANFTPGSCDFEIVHGFCDYTNDHSNDDFDWMLGSGPNFHFWHPTGPSGDHTNGSHGNWGNCALFHAFIRFACCSCCSILWLIDWLIDWLIRQDSTCISTHRVKLLHKVRLPG